MVGAVWEVCVVAGHWILLSRFFGSLELNIAYVTSFSSQVPTLTKQIVFFAAINLYGLCKLNDSLRIANSFLLVGGAIYVSLAGFSRFSLAS
jgi:hypothetical protein